MINRDTTILSSSSENIQYPLSNLKTPIATKKARGTGRIFIVDVDCITHVRIDSILFNSIDWETVKVQGNITSNFTSPVFEETYTPDDEHVLFNFMYKPITEQICRYWRFTFTNSVGANYCEVGKIFLGKSVQFDNEDMNLGWSFEERDFSSIKTNDQGQRFIDVVPKKQKRLKGSYKYVTIANQEIMHDLGDEHSKVYPVWMVLDDTETVVNDMERNAMYGYFEKIPVKTNVRYKLYDFNLSLVECL